MPPKKKYIKKNIKKQTTTKKKVSNNNSNINNIKINIGTKKSKREKSGISSNKNIQHSSAPYPVYNRAIQHTQPPTIINNAQPALQRNDNFIQKDLTNLKDELLNSNNVLLLEFDKKITDDIKERERIQEMKDAHKELVKAEKEALKAEKEAQEALDKELRRQKKASDQEDYINWQIDNNKKNLNYMLLLENKINDNNNGMKLLENKINDNNNFFQQLNDNVKQINNNLLLPSTDNIYNLHENNNNNDFNETNPLLDKNNNNNNNYTGKLQTIATNNIEVYNTDTQFNNEASQIISDDKNSETINDINLKETEKIIHKLAIEENNTNLINQYISLYKEVNGNEPNNDTIKRYSKPSANSSLTIMINTLKKTISEKPERVILVNKYRYFQQIYYNKDVDENFIYNIMRKSNGKKILEDKISKIEKMKNKITMKEISDSNNLKTTKKINNAWDSTTKAFSKLSPKPKSLTKKLIEQKQQQSNTNINSNNRNPLEDVYDDWIKKLAQPNIMNNNAKK